MADKNATERAQNVEIYGASGNKASVNAAGGLSVSEGLVSVVDAGNSTTTPLGAGATFTGAAVDVTKYSMVSVLAFSDVDSASGGIVHEFSIDGTNWDFNEVYSLLSAPNTNLTTMGVSAQWFRTRYTNGATPQGAFRLQTILHAGQRKSSTHRIGTPISSENDAELTLSVLTGFDNSTGQYQNAQLDQGKVLVKAEIASSNTTIQGKRFISVTGTQSHVGTLETDNFLLRNPPASGKNLVIDRQFLSSLTASTNATFRMYRGPTITAVGTTIVPQNAFISSAVVPVGLTYLDPTISARGTLVQTYTADKASLVDETSGRIVMPPNRDILITVETGNGKLWGYNVAWIEELE
jgi:hypothetical protein